MIITENERLDLLTFRVRHNLTQSDFAEEIGITKATYNAAEKRKKISDKTYVKIMETIKTIKAIEKGGNDEK